MPPTGRSPDFGSGTNVFFHLVNGGERREPEDHRKPARIYALISFRSFSLT